MIRHQSQSIRHMSVDVLDECEIPLTLQRPNVHLSAQRRQQVPEGQVFGRVGNQRIRQPI